jgi:hypothetical protein
MHVIRDVFYGAFAAAVLVFVPAAGNAQAPVPNTEAEDRQAVGLRSLSSAVTSLVIAADGAEPGSTGYRALSLLRAQVEMFERRASSRQFVIDPDNAALFEAYASLFSQISRASLDASVLQVIDAAARDFSVRNEFASSRAALLGQGNSLLVEVTVKSVSDAGLEVDGYEVTATPVAMARRGIWLFPFANLTNDAVLLVPPGWYEFRARRNGRVAGGNTFSVGERGTGAERKVIIVDGRQ